MIQKHIQTILIPPATFKHLKSAKLGDFPLLDSLQFDEDLMKSMHRFCKGWKDDASDVFFVEKDAKISKELKKRDKGKWRENERKRIFIFN